MRVRELTVAVVRRHLATILRQVKQHEEPVLITRWNETLAVLMPPALALRLGMTGRVELGRTGELGQLLGRARPERGSRGRNLRDLNESTPEPRRPKGKKKSVPKSATKKKTGARKVQRRVNP